MKRMLVIVLVLMRIELCAQEIPEAVQQQVESLGENIIAGEQEIEQLSKDRLNINEATEEDLQQLTLTEEQIKNLINYRQTLGFLLTVYELQAVPGWDIETIRRIISYITVENVYSIKRDLLARLYNGETRIQVGGGTELAKENEFIGADYNLFFRYKYRYKNLLQYGVLGEKDAGELLFDGKQKAGFDYYSAHCFIRNTGIFKAIALGDYTVNLGQGLIHWQSLAFKKSGDPTMLRRNSEVLKPYSSTGEFNFHRGAGATIKSKRWETTLFVSLRKLDATIVEDSSGTTFATIRQSGYHRTSSELKYRNNLKQFTSGFNIGYKTQYARIAANIVRYHFDLDKKKSQQPFQHYAFTGDHWTNASIDYSYQWKNILLFGEWAVDQERHSALVNGMLMSLDRKLDVSLLHRSLPPRYQSLYGNAFTENADPVNENGLFTGIRFVPFSWLRFDLYVDTYKHPWLKFGVDQPSSGSEYLLQLTWKPTRQVELVSRFRNSIEEKTFNDLHMSAVRKSYRRDWRLSIRYDQSMNFSWLGRIDLSWYREENAGDQKGFQAFMEFYWRKILEVVSLRVRLQCFDTDGYEVRIYTYENELSSFSAPQFSGRGQQIFTLLQCKLRGGLRLGMKLSMLVKENEKENISDKKMTKEIDIKGLLQYYF